MYKLVAPLTLAFTAEFAQKHKQVVTVARAAFRRIVASGPPRITILRAKQFLRRLSAQTPKELTTWFLLYDSSDDQELKSLSVAQASSARSFPEFMRIVGQTQITPLA